MICSSLLSSPVYKPPPQLRRIDTEESVWEDGKVLLVMVVQVLVVPTMTLCLQDYAMYRGMTANFHFLCAHTADWIE